MSHEMEKRVQSPTSDAHVDLPESPLSAHDSEHSSGTGAAFHNYLRALYPFEPSDNTEEEDSALVTVPIKPGDLILVHSIHANGWADGTVFTTGQRGWLPTNYCEAYEHPYTRNLLNAMTQFWDLLAATKETNLATFVRQDYIRGLIAGVRCLLEYADCLHRDAALVQQHTGIRRMRKGLLADLSSLVQIARGLQETIGECLAGESVNYLIQDLMKKAFKVATRAVGFVDMWSKETNETKDELAPHQASQVPITPPLDVDKITMGTKGSIGADEAQPAEVAPDAMAADGSVPKSTRPLSSIKQSRRSSVAHRMSSLEVDCAAPSPLASDQLARVHDRCISYIGAFIGHHIHSRPSAEVIETTERLVQAGKDMHAVVTEVAARDVQRSASIQHVSAEFESRLDEIIKATEHVFNVPGLEHDEVANIPEQSDHLVNVGTALIRVARECVIKTRALIEQIGDFDLAEPPIPVSGALPNAKRPVGRPASSPSNGARVAVSFEERLSSKILPPTPPLRDRAMTLTESFDSSLESSSSTSDGSVPMTPGSPGSQKSVSGPHTVQRRSTIRLSQPNMSSLPSKLDPALAVRSSSPVRKSSVGISISGSTDTFRSSVRDSVTTTVSEVSTRATTPDHAKELKISDHLLNSFTSKSSIHSAATEDTNEAESQLLYKTYASELTWGKDGHVAGGSLPALIEQLTIHDPAPDPQFVSAFFVTFRLFTTPRELAQGLTTRFEYIGDSKTVGTPVRLRIYNVFKGWLETYWNPAADKDALGEIRFFAMHKLKPHLSSAGDRLIELTRKVTAGYHTGTLNGPLVSGVGKSSLCIASQYDNKRTVPERILTKGQHHALRAALNGGPPCSILDFDPLELARQLSLMTSRIFCDIQPEELLSLAWGKRDSPKARNVRALCSLNTDLSHVVGDTILAPEQAKKRALVIKHWTKIASFCLEMNNYDSVMGIMCALNSSVVQRLKRTWDLVSRKTMAKLAELNVVVDFSHNHRSLRSKLETPLAPCIPFLGIYLTDLTFLDAGNPTTKHLPGAGADDGEPVLIVNFDKHRRMAEVVGQIQRFQVPYKLQAVPEMQVWIESNLQRMRSYSDEVVTRFHRRSLLVEPKHDEPKSPKTVESRRLRESASSGERSQSPGGKDRLETLFKSNSFHFKLTHPDLPRMDTIQEKQQR